MNEYRFTWGDSVRVKGNAPSDVHPGMVGSICGMRATEAGVLYLVEGPSGEAGEICEEWLEFLPE